MSILDDRKTTVITKGHIVIILYGEVDDARMEREIRIAEYRDKQLTR